MLGSGGGRPCWPVGRHARWPATLQTSHEFAQLIDKVSVAPTRIEDRCVVADWSHCINVSNRASLFFLVLLCSFLVLVSIVFAALSVLGSFY